MTTFAGTASLTRLALRRDRWLACVWVLVLVVVCYSSAAATPSLYHSAGEQVSAARAINASPALVALYGPILDVHSVGELSMTKMTVLYAAFLALLALVLVRRHTRGDEERGLTELLSGTPVGPDAPMAAAVLEAGLVCLATGVLAAVANILGGLPVWGSLVFGAGWAVLGWVAAALTALACQVSASARTCAALAGAAIGVLYLLRAVGDTGAFWLSWLTPFGWATQLRAWSGPRWWVFALYVALTAALVALAAVLRRRRDLGSGLVAARPGPVRGSSRLGNAVAVAWRLHRGMLLGWTVGVAGFGVLMGSIAPNVGSLLTSPGARTLVRSLGGPGAIAESLLAAEMSVAALVVSAFAITVVAHAGRDESDGRGELLLATATSRRTAFLANASVAFVGGTWLLLLAGLGAAVGFGHGRVAAAGLAQAPAMWVVAALAVLGWSLRSDGAVLGWVVLVLSLLVGQVAELLRLPSWVSGLSPYAHLAAVPAVPFAWSPAVWLTVVAVVCVALGGAAYARRDVG